MNVTVAIKLAKFAAVIGLVTLALITYRQMEADKQNLRDAVITANAEKVTVQARAQELENANRQLEVALSITEQSIAASNAAIIDLNRAREIAQEEADRQRDVLEDANRLQLIANRRTSLLERMVNRATKERFNELESLFNED